MVSTYFCSSSGLLGVYHINTHELNTIDDPVNTHLSVRIYIYIYIIILYNKLVT